MNDPRFHGMDSQEMLDYKFAMKDSRRQATMDEDMRRRSFSNQSSGAGGSGTASMGMQYGPPSMPSRTGSLREQSKSRRSVEEDIRAMDPYAFRSQAATQKKLNTLSLKENFKKVGRAIGKWMMFNAISFNAADSGPYYQVMIDTIAEYGKGVKGPSGKQLAGEFLQFELDDLTNHIKELRMKWPEYGCTIMCDGWSSHNRHPIVNFMVYCKGDMMFHKSVDATNQKKTAEYIYSLMKSVVEEVGKDNVVQIVTDNESSYKAAGTKMMKKYPNLFWSPCAAHCIDLMLEDIGDIPSVASLVRDAKKITSFIYSSNQFVELMRTYTKGRELLRPGITRFATEFIAIESLIRYKSDLKVMFASGEWREFSFVRHRKREDQATEVAGIVLGIQFWKRAEQLVAGMEPLVLVLKIVDQEKKPTMPVIYDAMDRAKLGIKDSQVKEWMKIWDIIDSRWERQLHCHLHAAAYFLNPLSRYGKNFSYDTEVRLGLKEVIKRLEPDVTNQAMTLKELAQKLYEGIQFPDGKSAGLITYIRTDGLHISDEAVKDIRSLVLERYGPDYVSDSARKYFKKVKNAQEAHEAIRPTDIQRLPSMLIGMIDEDCLKLYALIWSRTMACQMEPAIIDQIQLDIGCAGEAISFRSACSRVGFLGYQAIYKDVEAGAGQHTENEGNYCDEIFKGLNSLKSGDPLCLGKVELKQHHTHPPPRYSEGTLVKKLEELGIGRPSTYASMLKVLKDRNYVTAKNRLLYPDFRGRMVSAFLANHFSEVTDYSFTADMETELDNVSAGMTEWKGLLKDYWKRFSTYCNCASDVHIHQVEKMLEKTLGDFLFASLPSRTCQSCKVGTLIFKVSRFAEYFMGCDQHPRCKYNAKTLYKKEDPIDIDPTIEKKPVEEPKFLGMNPGSSEKILLKNGPYGFYVQIGEDRNGYSPKRASVSQIKDKNSITLEDAMELLRYPVTLGNHPEDGHPVIIKIAKGGFSIRHTNSIAPVPKNMEPKDITLEEALKLLLGPDVKHCGRPKNKPKLEAVEAI